MLWCNSSSNSQYRFSFLILPLCSFAPQEPAPDLPRRSPRCGSAHGCNPASSSPGASSCPASSGRRTLRTTRGQASTRTRRHKHGNKHFPVSHKNGGGLNHFTRMSLLKSPLYYKFCHVNTQCTDKSEARCCCRTC